MNTLTVSSFKTMLEEFLAQLNEGGVVIDSITGSLQGEVKSPAPGGIKQFLKSQGSASVGVPSTAAIGQYDASMIVPLAFERGDPLQFYVESTVVDGNWRMSAVIALFAQPHLPGGVAVLPD